MKTLAADFSPPTKMLYVVRTSVSHLEAGNAYMSEFARIPFHLREIENMPPTFLEEARHRVGSTPESHARWLLRLLYEHSSYNALVLGERETLCHEIAVFIGETQPFPESEARTWLEQIRRGLRRLERGQGWTRYARIHYWIELDAHNRVSMEEAPSMSQTYERGKLVLRALQEAFRCPIYRCPGHECGRLFVLTHHRQRFCSVNCNNRTRVRRFRARRQHHP